ncbi:MAG: zinc-ribbon domain-containing protein [Thermoguttaceae bacterium]|nr:zinc-ribbon domain-containing protein [Thermoguttaceae bacterium]MDW8037392.1 hypothetical protein [Thermoguttaceae bacterium]
MPIDFRCPICTKLLRVPDGAAGRQAKCPACGNVITIAGGSPAAPSEVPPPAEGAGPWQGPGSAGGYPFPAGSQGYPSGGGAPPQWPQSAWGPAPAGPPPSLPGSFPAGPGPMSAQQYLASSRVSGPATWMMVLSIIHIVVAVILVPLFLLGIVGAGIVAGEAGPHARDDEIMELFVNLFFNFFSVIIGLALAIVVLLGAIRMKKLQSYGFAMTAAILSIIPCTSPCCFLIGTPIGIWALVVLNDPAVKAAFR